MPSGFTTVADGGGAGGGERKETGVWSDACTHVCGAVITVSPIL